MRILKVTQAYYPFQDRGGPAVKVRSIARALTEQGHKVTVLTADLGLRDHRTPPAEEVRDAQEWPADPDRVEVVYLATTFRYRSLTVNPGVLSFCRQRLREFDIVHIYGMYDLLGPAVAFFCRRGCIPYLVEPMGMFRPIVRNIWLKRLYHRVLGEQLLRGACTLIATSAQEQQELVAGKLPKEKMVIRRNGISIPERLPARGTFRRKWGIAKEAKVTLFLGRIVPKKAPDLLLRAFAACCDLGETTNRNVLVLAGPDGDPGYRRQLESLVMRLKVSGRVLFTGPLYNAAKWAAYQDADLFVLPSQNENFGNTVAEAVGCGTPVIVTDRCGVAPIIERCAGIVVPYDQVALQNALTRMLGDDAFREQLRTGCQKVTCQLSWQEPMDMIESLYQDLVGENHN